MLKCLIVLVVFACKHLLFFYYYFLKVSKLFFASRFDADPLIVPELALSSCVKFEVDCWNYGCCCYSI